MSPRPDHAWRRWALRLAAVVGVLLALLLGAVGPASAHATLVSSDPSEGAVLGEAPERATLTFDEAVELPEDAIHVYDAEGEEVAATATASAETVTVTFGDGAIDRGTYVVAWRVLSADGHPVAGSLSFSVGRASAVVESPPPPPESPDTVTVALSLTGALTYLGLFVAVGLFLFEWLILRDAMPQVVQRLVRLRRIGAVGSVVAGALGVPLAATYQRGGGIGDLGLAVGGVPNELLSWVLLTVGLGLAIGGDTVRRRWVAAVGVGLAVVAPSLVGHPRAYAPAVVWIASDVVHLTAGAVWLGGLVGLVLTLRRLAGRERPAAEALTRFSTVAAGVLVVLAATGTLLAWRILGSWVNLWESSFGRLLLVKLAAVLVVVSIAAWNRFRMLPRVVRAAGFGDRRRAAAGVARTVAAEAAVVLVVLGVTGFLVNTSPRPEEIVVPSGRTGVDADLAGDLRVLAVVNPRVVGRNRVLVQIQDGTGEPVELPRPPTVSVSSAAGVDLGDQKVRSEAAGTWYADVVLPTSGTWEVQVAVPAGRFENPVTTLEFEVR